MAETSSSTLDRIPHSRYEVTMADKGENWVSFDLNSTRKGDEQHWELPPWDDQVSKFLMPLCVMRGDRIIPVGTAFFVSRMGLVMSAAHNVMDGLRHHRRGDQMRRELPAPGEIDLDELNFGVLHRRQTDDGAYRVTFRALESLQLTVPADLMVGTIARLDGMGPMISPVLSPGMPVAGSGVTAVGYADMQFPEGGIPADGSIDFDQCYSHRLVASAGQVGAIFSTRFANGYGDGPCFLTDFEAHHGQSGGPVFGPDGICGVVWGSTTSFVESPSSIVSMIYPLVATHVKKTFKFGPKFTLNLRPTFQNLMRNGTIQTDGSEEKAKIWMTPAGPHVTHQSEPHNKGLIYEDFQSYLDGKPAESYGLDEMTRKLGPDPEANDKPVGVDAPDDG